MVNEFDAVKLSELGFLIKNATADYILLEDKEDKNEIIVWKLGNWLQFRCMIYDLGAGVGSSEYRALSETINRLHDVALGARISLSDTGEVAIVSDVLRSTVNDDVVATISDQLLFLSGRLFEHIENIDRGGVSLSSKEIDEMLM